MKERESRLEEKLLKGKGKRKEIGRETVEGKRKEEGDWKRSC